MSTYILIILLWGSESSIHEHIEFNSKKNCEAAAAAVHEANMTLYRAHSIIKCVEK
jgi:cellobiose-specific phosphotransferase system component IIA